MPRYLLQVRDEAKQKNTQPNHVDPLPPPSEAPAPSSVLQRDPSLSGSQPGLIQMSSDSSSSTGLPLTLQSSRRSSYAPSGLLPVNPSVESMLFRSASKPGSKARGRNSTSRSEAVPLATEGAPDPRVDRIQSGGRPLKQTETSHPSMEVGMDYRSLAQQVLATDRKSAREAMVAVDLTAMQDSGFSPRTSRPPSLNSSRKLRQRAFFPIPAGSSDELPVAPPSFSRHTDPKQSRVSDDDRAEYRPTGPPGWYVKPGTDGRSDYGATRHMNKELQAQGNSYITSLPSDEPRPNIAEPIPRYDLLGSLYPPGPPSQIPQSLLQGPQQGSTGAGTHQSGANDTPSVILRSPNPKRPVSRTSQQRPNLTMESAYGSPRTHSRAGSPLSVVDQDPNDQWPPPKEYRRRSPALQKESSLRPGMGSGVAKGSQAYPVPSLHAQTQPLPSRQWDRPQSKASAGTSRRLTAMVITQEDPLSGDGSRSSSSMWSAALEEHDQKPLPKGPRMPYPGTVDTRVPTSRRESTSLVLPPSIYVSPPQAPRIPPSSLAKTQVDPPASMVDSRATLHPTMKDNCASFRSARHRVYPGETQRSASERSERSQRQPTAPPGARQTAQEPSDPRFREPLESFHQLQVPGKQRAMPGLSRRGSREKLQESIRPTELGSRRVDSESSSGDFSGSGFDGENDYSEDSEDSKEFFDDGILSSSPPRQKTLAARTAEDDHRSHAMRHEDAHRPLARSWRSSQPTPPQVVEPKKPSARPPPQQRLADGVPSLDSGHIQGGRQRSRSRGQMPGRFPEGA